MNKPTDFMKLVKIEHSLFSLPLLCAGAYLGADGWPPVRVLFQILLVGASGRTLAMVLNRIVDRKMDRLNPRTAGREIPSGKITVRGAAGFAAVCGAVYLAGCLSLGPWPTVLAPVPIGLFVLYPYLKRFTWLCHLGIGATFAAAALGGWVAASGRVDADADILLLAGFVFLWSPAFDILYALADMRFDRENGVNSIPARWGKKKAVAVSRALHLAAFLCLAAFAVSVPTSAMAKGAIGTVGALMFVEAVFVKNFHALFLPVNASVSAALLAISIGTGGA